MNKVAENFTLDPGQFQCNPPFMNDVEFDSLTSALQHGADAILVSAYFAHLH
jgi:hypothetical protein